jgi:hypothetical protein
MAASYLSISATAGAAGRPAVGTAGNPLALGCAAEAWTPTPVPQRPQPGDLAAGPLIIPGGKRLADANPQGYGDHGRYKVPFIVKMGATVTVTIQSPARGFAVIDNYYTPVGGVAAITYHACAHEAGFYPQSIVFLHGRTRGCIPLAVTVGRHVDHLTLDLFAGGCELRMGRRTTAAMHATRAWLASRDMPKSPQSRP